jgi:hypothetical protein
VAVFAQFQCWTGRSRRPAPGRHQHLLLAGRLLRHSLRRFRFSQQRTQIQCGIFQVEAKWNFFLFFINHYFPARFTFKIQL